ncbi:hypothetical protein C8Q74DRAFT_324521 [Fomes fomentarius]|nr:hypothetical protein C8Q74DRAFT_324521 [Fomes fomentarius]
MSCLIPAFLLPRPPCPQAIQDAPASRGFPSHSPGAPSPLGSHRRSSLARPYYPTASPRFDRKLALLTSRTPSATDPRLLRLYYRRQGLHQREAHDTCGRRDDRE